MNNINESEELSSEFHDIPDTFGDHDVHLRGAGLSSETESMIHVWKIKRSV